MNMKMRRVEEMVAFTDMTMEEISLRHGLLVGVPSVPGV